MSTSYNLRVVYGAPVLITDELGESIDSWPHDLGQGCELIQSGAQMLATGCGYFLCIDRAQLDLMATGREPMTGVLRVPVVTPAEALDDRRLREVAATHSIVIDDAFGWYVVGESF